MRTQFPGQTLPLSALATHRKAGFVQPAKLSDLIPGTQIRAIRDEIVCHAGPITDISTDHDLLWVFDEQSRTRKIIEPHEFTIVALLETATNNEPEDKP